MDTLEFSVNAMTCDHCVKAVTEELAGVEGVRTSAVDLTTKQVVVTGHNLQRAAINAAVNEAGYEVQWP